MEWNFMAYLGYHKMYHETYHQIFMLYISW